MNWTEILTMAVPLLLGGGIGSLVTLGTTRRRAEWELLNDQLSAEMKRNGDLMQQNIEKEERFRDQTKRLRESQDRELELNKQILQLTKDNGQLELELAKVRCNDQPCPWRKPPTASTPPPPDIDRDEWHKQRRKRPTSE